MNILGTNVALQEAFIQVQRQYIGHVRYEHQQSLSLTHSEHANIIYQKLKAINGITM